MMQLNKCSVVRSLNYDGISCFKKDELKEIINTLNKEHKFLNLKITGTKKELWNSIQNTLEFLADPKKWDKCNEEWCWLKTCIKYDKEKNKCYKKLIDEIGDKELANQMIKWTFRPNKPSGKPYKVDKKTGEIIDDVWLSTTDIRSIMKQFEDLMDEFIFKGPVPVDTYKCTKESKDWCSGRLINEVASIDLKDLKKKGKKSIGIIFNLDKHDESGSHWVSVYIDLVKGNIDYFDSAYAHSKIKDIPNDILNYITYIKRLGENENINFKIRYNKIKHQKKNSECGMYSIYFIIKRLLGTNFDKLVNNKNDIIKDIQMNTLRNLLYK